MERILLNAMLSSDRARAEMLPALLPELTDSFVTREVFEGLRQAAGSRRRVFVFRSGGPFTGSRTRNYCVTPLLPMSL